MYQDIFLFDFFCLFFDKGTVLLISMGVIDFNFV